MLSIKRQKEMQFELLHAIAALPMEIRLRFEHKMIEKCGSKEAYDQWITDVTSDDLDPAYLSCSVIQYYLLKAFDWEDTREGSLYWCAVYNGVRDLDYLDRLIEKP